MTTEEKAKRYDAALKEAKKWYKTFVSGQNYPATDIKVSYEWIFPELKEPEDERIRKTIIRFFKDNYPNEIEMYDETVTVSKALAWLEKQGGYSAMWKKNTVDNKPTLNHSVLIKNIHGIAEGEWNGKEWIQYRWSSTIKDGDVLYWMDLHELEKQGEPKEYTFKSIPRLLDMIEPSDRAKAYCQKLIGSLVREGYNTDAKIIDGVLKGWNGEDVPMAVMDEQKPADKIEPKFKVGDWITNGEYTWKVIAIQPLDYILQSQDGNVVNDTILYVDRNFHLWTIQDAKDGDVLQLGTVTAIFKKYIGQEKCICYCSIDEDGVFEIPIEDGEDNIYGCTNTTPATKEQRDLLFQKMNEEGYEWNAELKKVSKITTPADVGFEELGKAWAEEANKQNLANSAKTCKKSQRMISAAAKEALYDKPAWSEEDEKNLQGIINAIKELRCQSLLSEIEIYDDYIDWLKSLKQKYAWKPSDEQMDALETLYDNLKRL